MVLAAGVLVGIGGAACGSTGGTDTTTPDPTTATSASPTTTAATEQPSPTVADHDHEGGGLTGEVDITDAILTTSSTDCADYDATLVATADDIQRGILFDSGVVMTAGTDSCSLESNNIPNHDFNDDSARFATDVSEQSRSFELPRNPTVADSSTPLSQRSYDGVFLNGVPLDALSAGCYLPDDPAADADGNVSIGCSEDSSWLTNPLGTDHLFGADEHNAHTQPDGAYHYHGNPRALFDDDPGSDGSPVIGFAADGFPIFGSWFADPGTGEVREATPGWVLREGSRPGGEDNPEGNYDGTYYDDFEFTGAGDLDECNGMVVDGQYGYYVTDEFPYLPFCHAGTPDESFDKGGGGGGGGGGG